MAPGHYYVGRLAGQPVATIELFTGAGVASVQYVVTLPEMRRQGIGAAMTRHALRAAHRLGYRVAVLTASPDGFGVYHRLGFREYCRFRRFEWEPSRSGADPERVRQSAGQEEVRTMSAVKMEPYSPADRDACLAVFDANTPDAFAPHERDEFSAFLDSPEGRYWVLRDPDGSVVACGGADTIAGGRFGVLTWAMVLPTRQRQGLGSMLTRAGMAYVAAIPHAERIVLETSNLSAPFYERHGFRTTKVTPNHYASGVHLHNMALELDDGARQRLRGEPHQAQPRTHHGESGHTEDEAR